MAYNVLKGAVEGSVDQHADQEISGVKVFKNTVSASVFWDTDAQSPCATMKDVAIRSIVGGGNACVLTYDEEGVARANDNLTFKDKKLTTKLIHAEEFHGSGENLTSIPSDRFVGKVGADSISIGAGLHSVRGNLQVKSGDGISVGEGTVSINLGTNGGLAVKNSKIVLDLEKTDSIRQGGQNLSDSDLLVVSDISHGNISHTTLSNLYDNYIKNKVPQPVGSVGDIQIKNRSGFTSTSKLSYDTSSDILNVDGGVTTNALKINKSLRCAGSVHGNIKVIDSSVYETQADDYTLVCDTKDSSITVMLPPACNNIGRIINIKKANSSNEYKTNSHPVVLKVAEGTIDLTDESIIKTNHSSRTVQSDGNGWWIISSNGK